MRSIKYHHFIYLYGFDFKGVFDNAICMCLDFDCFLKLILFNWFKEVIRGANLSRSRSEAPFVF